MRDTIDMAREASNTPPDHHATPDLFGVSQLERFAALVRADERELCAKVCEDGVEYAGDELARQIRARGQA